MSAAGIVGGTGYTGVELLRLLVSHPEVRLSAITSRAEAGRRVDELFPNLRGHCDLAFTTPDDIPYVVRARPSPLYSLPTLDT